MDEKFERILALLKEMLLEEGSLAEDEAALLVDIHADLSAVYEMTMDRRIANLSPAQAQLAEVKVPEAEQAMRDSREQVQRRLTTQGILVWQKVDPRPN